MRSTIINSVRTFGQCTLFALFLPVVFLVSSLEGPKCGNAHREHQKRERPRALLPPPLLPTRRIDTRQRPAAEQHSHFFKLPLELRLSIYEHILGGRQISLQLGLQSPSNPSQWRIRSRCFTLTDEPDYALSISRLTEPISSALLLSCRQIYLEARPILHQHNKFIFWASELEVIIRCALGQYCLPDIRNVHIVHDNPAYDVFPILQQMRLERLEIWFKNHLPEQNEPDAQRAVLESAWGRDILRFRKLRQLELRFHSPRKTDKEDPVYNKHLAQMFSDLMVGAGADERYRTFLEEFRKRRGDFEISA